MFDYVSIHNFVNLRICQFVVNKSITIIPTVECNIILHLQRFSQYFARKIIYTDNVINVLNCQYVVIILAIHYIYANGRSYFGCVIYGIIHPILIGIWRTYLTLKTFDIKHYVDFFSAVRTRYSICVVEQVNYSTTNGGGYLF